jgi:2'-5' RNA ligase
MLESHPKKDGTRIRSFIAVNLDVPVLQSLRHLQRTLADTDADVRWVRPEAIHVTLKFLGDVDADLLSRVHAAVVAELHEQPALSLQVRGLGAFPSLRRPRVLWAGLLGDGLATLAPRVDAAVVALGFEPEQRSFTPHVTLGRVNSLRGWPGLEALVKAHIDDDFGCSEVGSLVIYRSVLQPNGAVHTPLWTIPLTQNKGTP